MPASPLTPVEQLKQDIASVHSELNSLIEKAKLNNVRNEFSELDATISGLSTRVQKVRERNYAFDKIMEPHTLEIQKQWGLKRGGIQSHITFESNNLQNFLRPLESRVSALSLGSASQITVNAIKNELNSFETKITASERSAREMFAGINTEVSTLKNQLSIIEKSLDWGESASFGFLPGESLVRAVKAIWTRDQKEDKEDPDGILFLTDQRLIFEQREEVATKKVLFVTTERQKIQQIQFEVPVFSITGIKATKQGLFKNEDWIELDLESGAFARNAKLHLDGQDCNIWQKLITQVKNRELDDDRAIAIDQAAIDRARSAPTKCPNCGGSVTKPVLRGMDFIICDFCGNKINI
jgi:hypothetical protein